MMASRAIAKEPAPDWRAAFRHSLRRAAQLTGAGALIAATVFFALALVSHRETDPSLSTAAGGDIANWMGLAGAWVSERALFLFGWTAILFLPLLYAFARKLWRDAGDEDTPHGTRWWRTVGVLVFAMALLSTVLSLSTDPHNYDLPASPGGITGLLGARGVTALAALLPEAARVWAIAAAWIVCLGGGAFLVGRIFALDWAQLLTLPLALRCAPR